jgi:hemerythrin
VRYLRWHEGLETGDHDVDEQHRDIHAMVNDLNARSLFGDNPVLTANALERLLDHVTLHFQCEEALMARTSYPRAEEHIAIHRTFAQTVFEMLAAQGGGHGPTIGELATCLEDWLQNHVREEDQLLVEHIRALESESPQTDAN